MILRYSRKVFERLNLYLVAFLWVKVSDYSLIYNPFSLPQNSHFTYLPI